GTWRWVLAFALCGCGDDDGGAASGSSSGGRTSGATGDPSTTVVGTTSTDTGTPTTGVDETGSSSGGEEPLVGSCEGMTLLPRPADTAERGPWAVGARTVEIDGLTVEVWYPAADPPAGTEPVVYDIREALPVSEQDSIPDEDNPYQECDCYRDLPIDDANGPYPVVLFVHGTAGFRTQSLPHMVHWASRGFVVMAADHPGLWLADLLGLACGQPMVGQDLAGNLASMLAAVRGETAGLEDFGDRLDGTRIGAAGHSAGGNAVSGLADEAQVIIPMAAGGVPDGSAVQSRLILGALSDTVVPYQGQTSGYMDASPRKRLVGIANTGHLAFSELCSLRNDAGDNIVEVGVQYGVCGTQLAGGLFQCDDSFTPDTDSWEIINFSSAAVLEETLHCEPNATAQLGLIQGIYPVVLEFFEEL
ncbi:MAG: hypothetical protein K0V04_10485, partial [Deltaproteobacteria bacterium]|nr:hypothetical protein [Deltaproteobacteria bacterium]